MYNNQTVNRCDCEKTQHWNESGCTSSKRQFISIFVHFTFRKMSQTLKRQHKESLSGDDEKENEISKGKSENFEHYFEIVSNVSNKIQSVIFRLLF